MKETIVKEKNIKYPLYVTVYETISGWLREGRYKPGEKLPGENILAEQMNVSRGTLRQAMLLLQEDGLIMNHQGKGNVVLSNQDISKTGLERLNNPIVEFSSMKIDRVDTQIGFQPPTQKHQQVLKLRPSSLIAVMDITYYSQETPMGYASIYMPYEVLSRDEVDFENTDTVYQYYCKLLASNGLNSEMKIRMTNAREKNARILGIQEGASMLVMEEVICSEYDIPVLSQKLYFKPEQHEFVVHRKNDRSMGI